MFTVEEIEALVLSMEARIEKKNSELDLSQQKNKSLMNANYSSIHDLTMIVDEEDQDFMARDRNSMEVHINTQVVSKSMATTISEYVAMVLSIAASNQ